MTPPIREDADVEAYARSVDAFGLKPQGERGIWDQEVWIRSPFLYSLPGPIDGESATTHSQRWRLDSTALKRKLFRTLCASGKGLLTVGNGVARRLLCRDGGFCESNGCKSRF